MKLFELFEQFPKTSSDDFFAEQDKAEQLYNPEVWNAKQKQEEFYKNHRMGLEGFVPVFDKPHPQDTRDKWTTKPEKDSITSAGFRGRENVKRYAGHQNYDRGVEIKGPHDDPPMPLDQEQLIKDALRRLGLD